MVINIFIDGLPIFLNNSDLGEYCRATVHALKKELNIHMIKDIEISVRGKEELIRGMKLFHCSLNRKADDYHEILGYMDNFDIDVYHCFNNGFSFSKDMGDRKCIATINHLIPLEYEEFYKGSYKEKFFSSIYNALNNSSKLICLSGTSKNNLATLCSLEESKIEVVYPGVSDEFRPLNKYLSVVYLKSKFGIEKDFILFSGDFHRRKQIEDVLEVFLRLSHVNSNLKLVFITTINKVNIEYFEEINNIIRTMGMGNKVKFITSATEEEKVYFYNNALFYIDFSLYDDLNYSIIQAFKCKCPIICSDIEIFRELLGNNAMFVDLENINRVDIIQGYMENIENKNLYTDSEFVQLCNRYSVDSAVTSLINIYNNITV